MLSALLATSNSGAGSKDLPTTYYITVYVPKGRILVHIYIFMMYLYISFKF